MHPLLDYVDDDEPAASGHVTVWVTLPNGWSKSRTLPVPAERDRIQRAADVLLAWGIETIGDPPPKHPNDPLAELADITTTIRGALPADWKVDAQLIDYDCCIAVSVIRRDGSRHGVTFQHLPVHPRTVDEAIDMLRPTPP